MKKKLPGSITCNGATHCLKHLTTFVHLIEKKTEQDTDMRVRVRFESHVFSRRAEEAEQHDFIDENDNKRVFCQDRYNFSHCLADEVRKLFAVNSYSMQQSDRNGYNNLVVITPAQTTLEDGEHIVLIYYFYPSKVSGIDIEMRVKSCYKKTLYTSNVRKERIRVYAKRAFYSKSRVPKDRGR